LEVEIVARPGERLRGSLAVNVADRAAEVFGTPTGHTWVRLRILALEQYAEDGGGPEPGVHPVFVSVLKAELPEADVLAAEIEGLTEAIATACDRRPQNVHIRYEPAGGGRMAFGGRLV
jgi:hypothetical protein